MKKVALITGGSGFLGRSLIKHLLSDSYDVILLLRNRTVFGRKNGKINKLIPAKERHDEISDALNANAEQARRIHIIEAEMASFDPDLVTVEIHQLMFKTIGHDQIDFFINCAGRLTMDYEGQDPTQKDSIKRRNRDTNVGGMENLLEVIRNLGDKDNFSAPSTRIIRPSIIAGKGSKDAYMAFLDYLGKGVGPIQLAHLARMILRFKPSITIPLPSNPNGILDVIDIKDVVNAMAAFICCDQIPAAGANNSELDAAAINSTIVVRHFHHVSTCYVHGESSGTLKEDALDDSKEDFKNSYEATKARAEGLLEEWNKQWEGEKIRYNQVSNPLAPTMQTVIQETLRAFNFSDQAISGVRTVSPGPQFDNAMKELKADSRLAGYLVAGLWEKVPMLSTYLVRKDATVFDTENTVKDIESIGQKYEPRKFVASWIRQELL